MPRPKKNATPEVAEETSGVVEEVKEKATEAVEKVSDTVKPVATHLWDKLADTFDAELGTQLKDLGKGAAIAAADAALVHLADNVNNLELGNFKGTAVALTGILVRELRSLLHGAPVSDEVHLEALEVALGGGETEPEPEPEKKEEE